MGRYRKLGVGLDRNFRKDIDANFDDVGTDVDKSLADSSNAKQTADAAKVQSQNAETVATQANATSDDVQQQLNTIVIESGTSDAEVLQARGGEPVLNDRLNKVDTQLAETVKKGEVSVGDINKNLGKFDQTYMSDEFLQQMAGNTPINGVPADRSITTVKLADKAVTFENTNFLTVGKNLFNKDTAITGYYINQNSGALIALAGYISSDYIRVFAGIQYTVNSIRKFAIYDNSYAYISGVDTGGSNYTFTPSQDGYVRFSYQTSIISSDEVQLEKASSPSTYEPFTLTVKGADKPKTGSVKLTAYGNKYDIKSEFSDSEEIVIRTTKNGSANGSFNFQETLVGGKKIHATHDDITPVRTFATVGGNHGYTTVFQITNNGKTSVDIGSQWTDGTITYVLLQIKGSNLIFGCPYTEVSGKVTSAYVAPTASLTHVSGATNTASIPLSGVLNTQLYPSTGRKNVEYRVDGKLVTAGGDYYGEKVEVTEVYDILDYKAIIEYAKAAKADFANTVDTIAGVLQISNRFTFTKGGRCTTSTSIRALKPVDLGRTGTMQSVWLNSAGYTTKRYVPNVLPKSGIDFVNVVNMTNYATTVLITSADLVNPAIPPSRYVDYLEDGSGNKQYAFTMGYILDKTNSKHTDRLANVSSTLWEFRDSKKSYPTVLEGKSLASGDYFTFQGFRNYFKPSSSMLTEDKVSDDSAVYLYLDRLTSTSYNNTNFTGLLGKKLTVIESSGFTLLNDTFDANGVSYKFTTNNGYAIIKAQ